MDLVRRLFRMGKEATPERPAEQWASAVDEASLRKVMRWNKFDTDPKITAWQGCANGPSRQALR